MKILLISAILFLCGLYCFADEVEDVETFFYDYVSAANNYSCDYFDYYSSNPKIIRVVEKPDGTQKTVCVPFERYKSEARKSSKLMKLRQYKNRYLNVKIFPYGNDYKIIAMRMPSTSDYKVPAHFIIGKDENGNWKIKEESMNTKVQRFLRES